MSDTSIRTAIKNTLRVWPSLRVFIDEPKVWLDKTRSPAPRDSVATSS